MQTRQLELNACGVETVAIARARTPHACVRPACGCAGESKDVLKSLREDKVASCVRNNANCVRKDTSFVGLPDLIVALTVGMRRNL